MGRIEGKQISNKMRCFVRNTPNQNKRHMDPVSMRVCIPFQEGYDVAQQ